MENFAKKLSQIQDTSLKNILSVCHTQLENEYKQNVQSFISNLPTIDLIKSAGIFLEKQSAYSKLQTNFKEDWYEIKVPYAQTNRQQIYLSNIECINRLFIDLFFLNYFQTNLSENTTTFDIQNEQKFVNLIQLFYQKEALNNFIDFLIYDKWDYKIENQHLKIEPKDDISKMNYLRSTTVNFKKKAELNYIDKFIETLLSSKIPLNILSKQRFLFAETFSGYKTDSNTLTMDLNNAKELVENCHLDFEREFLTEQMLFGNHHLSKDELKIILTNRKELNVSNMLRIGILFKRISRLYIKRIEKAVEIEENREDDPMLRTAIYKELNLKAILNQNNHAELEKIFKEFQDKKEQIQQEIGNSSFQINLNNNIFIVELDKEELKKIIKSALNLLDCSEIERFFEIFKYEPDLQSRTTRFPRLNFQSLFILDNQVVWYPNMWAFVGIAEKLFESLLDKGLISLDSNSPISTKTENFINEIFKNAGFYSLPLIDNNESHNQQLKDLKNPNDKKIKGDLDGAAFDKEEIGIHFELKFTGIRNYIQLKDKWKNDKILDAASRQIPNIRKFIDDFPDIIRQKFNLPNDFEIDINKIASFIISNSFDYDHEEFNGYLKINLLELMVLLTDKEIFLHEYEDYLKIWIKRIKKQGNSLVPKEYLVWAENKRESPFLNKSSHEMSSQDWVVINNFVDKNKKPFWKNPNEKTIKELVENLENNVVFDYLDDLIPEINYGSIKIGDYTFQLPNVAFE
ncbi:MAG: hypothetical protein NW226_10700 [Microscillaceae bacterium]|nr:hypothetical protein [Microscillaceae bacterium]